MTPDQFWYDNPQLLYNYEQKFIDEIKRKDVEMWSMGVIIKNAMQSTVVPIGLCKSASDIPKYMECPHKDEAEAEEKGRELTEEEKQSLRLKQYAQLKMLSSHNIRK